MSNVENDKGIIVLDIMLDPDWGRGKQIENSSKLNKKSIVTYSNCVPKRKY